MTPGVTQSVTFGVAPAVGVTHGVSWASLPETFSYEKGTRSLNQKRTLFANQQLFRIILNYDTHLCFCFLKSLDIMILVI